jgi:MYXO-CTERM domain-containing protein
VNGQPDPGHPATVALTVNGQPFCSGTLVTKTVVVTASHCIFPGIGVDPPTAIEVFFGADVSQGGTLIPVVEGKYNPVWDINLPNADEDVAVLRLASPAPVDPIPMGKVPPVGSVVTLVGFGITSANGSGAGVKRVATASVDALQGKTFTMPLNPSGTCNGDSGGTALFDDGSGVKLVGIHTRSDCQSVMLDERVDVHVQSFIQPFIDAGATCGPDGGCAKGCSVPDPDCPCAKDGFCAAACPDLTKDPDCDPRCVADGTCATDCPTPDPDCPTCVADGTCDPACTSDPDCAGGTGGGGGAPPASDPGPQPISTKTSGCGCDVPSTGGDLPGALSSLAVLALTLLARKRVRAAP